jgi:hypothetical protein
MVMMVMMLGSVSRQGTSLAGSLRQLPVAAESGWDLLPQVRLRVILLLM